MKVTIVEGNFRDKDEMKLYFTKGEKGERGPAGPIGDNSLQIGNVTSGETPSAEIIGTSPNQTLNLVLPKGDKGDKGDTGSLLDAFPVGALYFNANGTNPGTFIGGTWQRVAEGLFLVGIGEGTDTNGVTKTFEDGQNEGEYEHTLLDNELPKTEGTVSMSSWILNGSDQTSAFDSATGKFKTQTTSGTRHTSITGNTTNSNTNNTLKMSFGNDEAHNITPPSFGLYIWQRTA